MLAPDGEEPRRAAAGVPGATADLSAEDHRILAYASAIGMEFDFALLQTATGAPEEALAEHLENLVRRGILRERVGGDRFAFVEDEYRARVYRSLTESRLRILHRKIAAALDTPTAPPSADRFAELGRHYFLGKVGEKSLEYNRKAAEIARASSDADKAIHLLERMMVDLTSLPGDHRREQAEALQAMGDLYYSVGDFRNADRHYGEALERAGAEESGLTARLRLARSEIAREALDLDSAAVGALEARRLFEGIGDPVGVAQTHRLTARLAFQRGAYAESLDENMIALDLLEGNRDPRLVGRLSIDLGNSFALMGPDVRSVAIDWYEHAIECLTEAGDWVELSRAYHNLGVSVGETRPQEGLESLGKAREVAEKAHDSRSAGWALVSGVDMRLRLGQIDEAERDNAQAERLLQHLGDDLGVEQVHINRGEIAERRGQWEEGERAYLAAIEVCRRFEIPADEAEAQFRLARLRSKTRDWPGARAAFEVAARLELPVVRPNLAAAFEELRATLAAAQPAGGPVEPSTTDAARSGL